eukprot:1993679-Rhodomonas_salina.1
MRCTARPSGWTWTLARDLTVKGVTHLRVIMIMYSESSLTRPVAAAESAEERRVAEGLAAAARDEERLARHALRVSATKAPSEPLTAGGFG